MVDVAIVVKEVKTLEDAQVMKNIRNEGAMFMTRNKAQIRDEDQANWWENLDKSKVKTYLLHVMEFGAVVYPVAYGLIRINDDHCELTGAVFENERGKGYGRRIFEFILNQARTIKDNVELEVLETNEVARILYDSLGFKEISKKEGVIRMKYEQSNFT